MAIAHVCLECGWDLARTRPRREPHYGLMLVSCPRCQAASVRRVHPVWARWRQLVRVDSALRVLVTQVGFIVLFTFITTMTCIGALMLMAEVRRVGAAPHGAIAFLIWALGILPMLIGTWLTAAFSHLPAWKAWLGWLACVGLMLAVAAMFGPLPAEIDHRPRPSGALGDAAVVPWMLQGLRQITAPAMGVATIIALISLMGVVPGRGMLRLGAAIRAMVWRLRRKRRRLAAAAAT
jgi:hypothetical protein